MSLQEQRFTFDSSAKWITPEEKTDPEVQAPAGYLRRTFPYSRKAEGEGDALFSSAPRMDCTMPVSTERKSETASWLPAVMITGSGSASSSTM